MGIVDDMKGAIAASGGGKKGIFFLADGAKRKIRFLKDLEKVQKVRFHDKWEGFTYPCQKQYDRTCRWCDSPVDGQRDREFYVWQIWDYEAKKVLIFSFKAADNTPVPRMLEYFEEYGNVIDRDYMIVRTGKGTNTSYGMIPCEKGKAPAEAKEGMMKKSEVLLIFEQAFPVPSDEQIDADDDDEDEPDAPATSSEDEDIFGDDDDDSDGDDD